MSEFSAVSDRIVARNGLNYPLLLLSIFSVLNLLNYVDRYLLFAFANPVIEDLHLSYFQFSVLSSVLFAVFYSLAGLLIGHLADRWKPIRVIALGSAAWSLLTGATGFTRDFLQIALARSVISVGESSLTPAAVSVLKDAFPAGRLSLVTSIFYLGFPLGSGCSLLVAGLLGPYVGWRGTFILLGAVGLPLSMMIGRMPEPAPRSMPKEPRASVATEFRAAMADLTGAYRDLPQLRYLTFASIFMQFSLGGMSLEQVWLVRERGYPVHEAQLLFGAIYLASATIALIVGGALADRLQMRWRQGRLYALLLSTLFLFPSLAYRLVAPHTDTFLLLAVASNMFASLTIGPYYSLIQELSPPRIRATVFASVLLITTLVGFSAGSACFGVISTYLVSAGYAQPLTASYVIFTAIGLLSIPMIGLTLRAHGSQVEAT